MPENLTFFDMFVLVLLFNSVGSILDFLGLRPAIKDGFQHWKQKMLHTFLGLALYFIINFIITLKGENVFTFFIACLLIRSIIGMAVFKDNVK